MFATVVGCFEVIRDGGGRMPLSLTTLPVTLGGRMLVVVLLVIGITGNLLGLTLPRVGINVGWLFMLAGS